MTELFIDDKPAVLSKSANIRFTASNTYFTKSSSYTYDVELSLLIPENIRIFGNINRIDYHKENRRYSARLVVDNMPVMVGEAHITSVSENSVKVQLLGEAAAYNFGNKMDKTFIDELDMGDWFLATWTDGLHPFYSRNQGIVWERYADDDGIKFTWMILERLKYKGAEYGTAQFTEQEVLEMLWSGELGWVAYPTLNKKSGDRVNAIAYQETGYKSRVYYPFIRDHEGKYRKRPYVEEDTARCAFAIQPMIWKMAELIAKATGFSLSKEDNALYTDVLFRQIFIVNTNCSALCKKCLPHWTVNEWWTEIENTFGVIMSLDYSNKTMTLRKRTEHYKNCAEESIYNIIDEFESEMSDSEQDISVDNVGFAGEEWNIEDILTEEILEAAKTMEFNCTQDLLNWARENESSLNNYKGYLFKCKDNRQYIYSTNVLGSPGIIEVNMLRPRIVDEEKEEISIELKIVPAKYSVQLADLYPVSGQQPGATPEFDTQEPEGTFDVKMLEVSGNDTVTIDEQGELDLQAILEDDEEVTSTKEDKPDAIFIAITNNSLDSYTPTISLSHGGEITKTFTYPRAILRERSYANLGGEIQHEDSPYSLSLNHVEGQINLASQTIKGMAVIDTRVRNCIKFVSSIIPLPEALFYIRNKRFVCEKIECNISPDGLDKQLTGYFYEFDM